MEWILIDDTANKTLDGFTHKVAEIIARNSSSLCRMSALAGDSALRGDATVEESMKIVLSEFDSWDEGRKTVYICDFLALAAEVDRFMRDDKGIMREEGGKQ